MGITTKIDDFGRFIGEFEFSFHIIIVFPVVYCEILDRW